LSQENDNESVKDDEPVEGSETDRASNKDETERDDVSESSCVMDCEGAINVKLPKLTLSKFYGETSQWITFWNSYDSAIHQNPKLSKIWTLVDRPKNSKVLGCRWVFSFKPKGNKFKARLVAKGYCQPTDTCDDVYSPVVNFSIIRFFFTLLGFYKWINIQCDVTAAYLYAPISSTIYMTQPPGFEVEGNKVCFLNKAIYGLKQSGREWYFKIHKELEVLGFVKFEYCNCVYVYDKCIILLLYVDDIIIFGKNREWAEKGVNLVKQKFDLRVLGETRKLLGVNFSKVKDVLYMDQH